MPEQTFYRILTNAALLCYTVVRMKGVKSMELTFEPLTKEDLSACYELCMQSFSESVPKEEVERAFALCSKDPSYRLVAGKLDGKVVAYATLNFFRTVFDGMRPMATIWYVCVDPAYRSRGIGKALFAELCRICEQEQCLEIVLTCLPENEGAQRFYRSLGFRDDLERAFVRYYFEP